MTEKEIADLKEEAYTMNLQNLNDRLTKNEYFEEGIEVGIRELLEYQKQVNEVGTRDGVALPIKHIIKSSSILIDRYDFKNTLTSSMVTFFNKPSYNAFCLISEFVNDFANILVTGKEPTNEELEYLRQKADEKVNKLKEQEKVNKEYDILKKKPLYKLFHFLNVL